MDEIETLTRVKDDWDLVTFFFQKLVAVGENDHKIKRNQLAVVLSTKYYKQYLNDKNFFVKIHLKLSIYFKILCQNNLFDEQSTISASTWRLKTWIPIQDWKLE